MAGNTLIASVGGAPQVVTETLWALMNPEQLLDEALRGRAPFIPNLVYLVTTGGGLRKCRSQGLEHKVRRLFEQEGKAVPRLDFLVPRGSDGLPIEDIRGRDENVAYANAVTRLVMRLAAEPETRIHMSLAGGRKTMTSFNHTAMMFFGRPGDELSHVLVEPAEWENSRGFWWPGQPADLDEGAPGSADASKADKSDGVRVDLVFTPFVCLSSLLDESAFPSREPDYSDVIAQAEAALHATDLRISFERKSIAMSTTELSLPPREFCFYAVLAKARREGWPGAGPDGLGPHQSGWLTQRDFMNPESSALAAYRRFYENAFEKGDKNFRRLVQLLDGTVEGGKPLDPSEQSTDLAAMFSQARSGVKKLINTVTNHKIRQLLKMEDRRGTKANGGVTRFGLMMEPEGIRIEE